MGSSQLVGYCCLALAMIGVGSTVVASKIIGAGLPPFTATALRFAIAFPLLLGVMLFSGARFPKLDRHDTLLVIGQAAAGSVGYTVLLISGTRLTTATSAGIISGTLPAVALVIAIVLLGERPNRNVLLAALLATAGVLIVTVRPGGGGMDVSPQALIGNLLVFGAVVLEGLFILINKRLRIPIAPLPLSTLMSGIGLALAAIPALFERAWDAGTVTSAALTGVVYYALVPTVLGYLLWYAGSARTLAAEAALFTAFAPVSAVILATMILGEALGPAELIGMACVLGAIVLATYPSGSGWSRL